MSTQPTKPRRLGTGTVIMLAAALAAPSAISLAAIVGHDHPETKPVRDSAFGSLVYEASSICAKNSDAEVAFVGDRVIASTDRPLRVLRAIDQWVSKQPKATTPTAALAAFAPSPALDAERTSIDGTIEFPPPDDGVEPLTPVTAFDLPGDDVYDILGLVRSLRESGIEASPDYVARPQHHDFYMPDGTPTPTTDRLNPRVTPGPGPQLGEGVRITVFDTGLTAPGRIPTASPILPADIEDPDADGDGDADNAYVGHAQAIDSTIWALVPGAEITNASVTLEGISTDWSSAQRIVQVLDNLPVGDRPHLVLASFGTEACDVDPGVIGDELLPLSLRGAAEWVDQLSAYQPAEMALIAAAGNHGTTRRQYPAAFPTAIAVGALDTTLDPDGDARSSPDGTGHIAESSGRGKWVDVYAPGVSITTQHVGRPGNGVDFAPWGHPDDPAADTIVEGFAYSSGTSYAVPNFGGGVAEQMAATGETVWEAVASVTALRIPPLPPCDGSVTGNLTGVAIVWSDLAVPITDMPGELPTTRC